MPSKIILFVLLLMNIFTVWKVIYADTAKNVWRILENALIVLALNIAGICACLLLSA